VPPNAIEVCDAHEERRAHVERDTGACRDPQGVLLG
jgi:hypothetical protein